MPRLTTLSTSFSLRIFAHTQEHRAILVTHTHIYTHSHQPKYNRMEIFTCSLKTVLNLIALRMRFRDPGILEQGDTRTWTQLLRVTVSQPGHTTNPLETGLPSGEMCLRTDSRGIFVAPTIHPLPQDSLWEGPSHAQIWGNKTLVIP